MNLETRRKLWYCWGWCERHAWGFLAVDAAFRHGWMHGPAVLYTDLMERAENALHARGPGARWQVAHHLREKGPCLMCEAGFNPHSSGTASPGLVERGRDLTELRAFARQTRDYWQKAVCGTCAGDGSVQRCRRHLLADFGRGAPDDLNIHQALVRDMVRRLTVYGRSFRHGYHGTETEADRAALIEAVGWCSGWGVFLATVAD